MRKLATIRVIDDIQVHTNADALELLIIDGWQVVAQKGVHSVGDHVVYFEVDSFLPIEERYEFLRKSCYRNLANIGEGFRIRTIKLRKEISQGMVMPISEFVLVDAKVGDDVTGILNVQKYEPPIPTNLAGEVEGMFPSFIPKTDQERVQNIIHKTRLFDGEWEKTLKLDGSSMTVFIRDGETGVCSRNLHLKINEANEGNSFVKTFVVNELDAKMRMARKVLGYDFAIQGELMGHGICGNRENITGLELYVYDVYDITNQKYVDDESRYVIVDALGLRHVPVLDNHVVFDDINTKMFLEHADVPSMVHKIGEGVVFKSLSNPDHSFKVINNNYLLKCED